MDEVWVVDDEEGVCRTLERTLTDVGYKVRWTTDPEYFVKEMAPWRWDCLLLDLKLGGLSGIDYLAKIREIDPQLPVIMITAYDTVPSAVEAMKKGAFHYLSKPFDNEELKKLVANAVTARRLHREVFEMRERATSADGLDLRALMGHSREVLLLARQCRAVAATDVNVVLTGESGTGKEVVSRYIHAISSRKGRPFVPLDCASIPESLVETELFGYEKGAFTGAHQAQAGKLQQADGGTLFLDEVSNISQAVQAKLLRFLESRTAEPVGGRTPIRISARVIAATNLPLPKLVGENRFREDLFHRLNEFPINIPALRERPEDIPYLSLRFLKECEVETGKKFSGISEEAMDILKRCPWPGNVRQLRNTIRYAAVLAEGEILAKDISREIRHPASRLMPEISVPLRRDLPLSAASKEALMCIEKELIQTALKQSKGRKGLAARELGIDTKTLYNKLKEYKLS